jgi:hypothetical protein
MELDEDTRIRITMYLRQTLGIQYVNLESLQLDAGVFAFGSHRFVASGGWFRAV